MSVYKEKYENLMAEFHKGKTMVLSTSENDRVSSRNFRIFHTFALVKISRRISLPHYVELP